MTWVVGSTPPARAALPLGLPACALTGTSELVRSHFFPSLLFIQDSAAAEYFGRRPIALAFHELPIGRVIGDKTFQHVANRWRHRNRIHQIVARLCRGFALRRVGRHRKQGVGWLTPR